MNIIINKKSYLNFLKWKMFFWFLFSLSSRWNAPAGSTLIGEGVDSEKRSGDWTTCVALWWNGETKRAIKFWFWFVFSKLILISIPVFWIFSNALMMYCKFHIIPCFVKTNEKLFVKKKLKKIHRIHSFKNFFYYFFICTFAAFFHFFFEKFSNLFAYFSWNSRIRFKPFFIFVTGSHESSKGGYSNHHMRYWSWSW